MCDVDRLAELEPARKAKLQLVEDLNRQANEVTKSIGKAKDAAEREARKEEGRKLREQKDAAQAEQDELDAEAQAIQRTIPNLTHPAAPIGGEHDSNRDLRRGGTADTASSISSRSTTSRSAKSWACSTSKPGRRTPGTAFTS